MIGTTLLQRYRVDARLGQGGMGTVYAAYDQHLERNVAIKVINNEQLGTQGRGQLLQEARAVARLNHPNIVSVYDAQEDGSVAFVVMELVNGKTLRDHRPASLDEIIVVARQVCLALDHAHQQGVIHRDLKPENIMLVKGQQIKLMDFGLAHTTRDARLPENGLSGTPAYISPEQIRENEPDERSDLYSFGVLLYELASGQLPFRSDSLVGLISQHLTQLPVPPKQINPAIDSHFEAIILRLLAKDPADRYPSASAILEELNLAYPSGSAPARAFTRWQHNLPAETTSFVGRQKEVAAVLEQIQQSRLVTLTGSGGIGKTRLSLHVAGGLVNTFPDGVWLVELAPLSDPGLVPTAVAKVFGLRDDSGYSISEKLCEYFSQRAALLVLDNCEHLMDACAGLADQLLRAAPQLKILASSREALGIPGEVAYRVPSLSLPNDGQHLEQSEAARMFIERARAVSPGFASTGQNADVIAQICRRLDGIPLALELAAARVNMLKVEQIAARLDDQFRLLTGGSRTALPRQQTLRAMIDWSWNLLSQPERALLRGVSVFAGGWSLEAAEAVCHGLQIDGSQSIRSDDVLDLLTQLVSKSLVLAEQDPRGEMRYRLLESIRQYAREKLWDAGQGELVRNHHLAYFRTLAMQVLQERYGPRQVYWHQLQKIEIDNFLAALEWSVEQDVSAGLFIAGSLESYWETQSLRDGQNWLKKLLSNPEKPDEGSARALGALVYANFSMWTSDLQESLSYARESVARYRQLGDPKGEAEARNSVAYALFFLGKYDEGVAEIEMALEISRACGDRFGEQEALGTLGTFLEGDHERAIGYLKESLAICRELGHLLGVGGRLDDLAMREFDRKEYDLAYESLKQAIQVSIDAGMPNLAWLYRNMSRIERERGNHQSAVSYIELSMRLSREPGAVDGLVWDFARLAHTYLDAGEFAQARAGLLKTLSLFEQRKNSPIGIVYTIEGIASLLTYTNHLFDALVLYSWTDTARENLNDFRPNDEQTTRDRNIETIRAGLSALDFVEARNKGKGLTEEQAITMAYQVSEQL